MTLTPTGQLQVDLSTARYVTATFLYWRPGERARHREPRIVKIDVAVGSGWSTAALVPMSVHALSLAHDMVGALPTADFTRLPWAGPDGDVNPNASYLGREIETPPFEDLGFPLRKGVHLHWMLPPCYRRGTTASVLADLELTEEEMQRLLMSLRSGQAPQRVLDSLQAGGLWTGVAPGGTVVRSMGKGERWSLLAKDGMPQVQLRIAQGLRYDEYGRARIQLVCRIYDPRMRFPSAPDRWLIVRHGATPRRWILESDRLVIGVRDTPGAGVAYPTGTQAHDEVPFGRLGRLFDADVWLLGGAPLGADERRIPELSVVGHGDPEFAAFYPNCYSVFGFHDGEAASMTPGERANLAYTVIGWHADEHKDVLRGRTLEEQIEQLLQKSGARPDGTGFDALEREALSEALGWQIESGDGPAVLPEATACYARIHIGSGDSIAATGGMRVEVAIGNTATEAAAALLADRAQDSSPIEGPRARTRREEQLEALHFESGVRARAVDARIAFMQSRHRGGFAAIDAGPLWTLVREERGADRAERGDPLSGLPGGIGALLDRLNAAQRRLNRAREALDDTRDQLFADWCKYLDCAYPDPDDAFFAPGGEVAPEGVAALLARGIDECDEQADALGAAWEAVEDAFERLHDALECHYPHGDRERPVLRSLPEPRYRRPRDPVLCLTGVTLGEHLHESMAEVLTCVPVATRGGLADRLDTLVQKIDSLLAAGHGPGMHTFGADVRRHHIMEWRAELTQFEDRAGGEDVAHAPRFLLDSFEFDPAARDLRPRRDAPGGAGQRVRKLSGRSVLHAGAKQLLLGRIDAAMDRLLREIGNPVSATPEPSHSSGHPGSGADRARPLSPRANVMQSGVASARSRKVLQSLARFRQMLTPDHGNAVDRRAHGSHGLTLLTQTLGGFNSALLMRSQAMQLPVRDPLGYADERKLAAKVADAVAGHARRSVLPEVPFNPMRAGWLRLTRLRLVDCFGRIDELDFSSDAVRIAETMTDATRPGAARLRPRFAQPARVTARWVAARSTTAGARSEANAAPEMSPMCGWIWHNHLDDHLVVHAADGAALGVLDRTGRWQPAPGCPPMALTELPDPGLARVLRYMIDHPESDLIRRMRVHLDKIHPEEDPLDSDPVFIDRRLLAVARARVGIELRGRPALDQSWQSLREAIVGTGQARDCDGVDRVLVQLRVGEPEVVGDGLVACWHDSAGPDGRFDQPLLYPAPGAAGRTVMPALVDASVAGGPRDLILVLDPRAPVHVESGILPVKELLLPRQHWTGVVRRMEAGFDVGPVLTPAAGLALPTPASAQSGWIWAENVRGQIARTDAPKPSGPADWGDRARLVEGWLISQPPAKETRHG